MRRLSVDLSDESMSTADDAERAQRMYAELAAFAMEMCDALSAAICIVDDFGTTTMKAIVGVGIERDAMFEAIAGWTSPSPSKKVDRVVAVPSSPVHAGLVLALLSDDEGRAIGFAAVLEGALDAEHERNRRERRLLAVAPRISCEIRAHRREREDRSRERRSAFLHELTARLRGLPDPVAIVSAAIDRLSVFFGSKRAGLGRCTARMTLSNSARRLQRAATPFTARSLSAHSFHHARCE